MRTPASAPHHVQILSSLLLFILAAGCTLAEDSADEETSAWTEEYESQESAPPGSGGEAAEGVKTFNFHPDDPAHDMPSSPLCLKGSSGKLPAAGDISNGGTGGDILSGVKSTCPPPKK